MAGQREIEAAIIGVIGRMIGRMILWGIFVPLGFLWFVKLACT